MSTPPRRGPRMARPVYLVVLGHGDLLLAGHDSGDGDSQPARLEQVGIDPQGRWWSVLRAEDQAPPAMGWCAGADVRSGSVVAAYRRRWQALAMLDHICAS